MKKLTRRFTTRRPATVEGLEGRVLMSGSFPDAAAVSMAYDADGGLHVAYQNTGETSLKYAKRGADGSWSDATVVDPALAAGSHLSVRVNAIGTPGVAYYDPAAGDLKYAVLNGAEWQLAVVDSKGDVGLHPSLAFDKAGRPLISYYSAAKQDVKLATFNGKKWKSSTVDAKGDTGRFSSIDVSPVDGSWAIAYESTSGGQVKIRSKRDKKAVIASWQPGGDMSGAPSVAFDAAGNPAVSFATPGSDTLMLYGPTQVKKKRLWTGTAVATGAQGAGPTSLDFTAGNLPLVVFMGSSQEVHLATQGAGGWSSTVIGGGWSFALDPARQAVAVMHDGGVSQFAPTLLPPQSLTATPSTTGGFDLAWAGAPGATGYVVQRAPQGGPFATIATLGAGATSAKDASADEGESYTYRVFAVDGMSSSLTAAATTATGPLRPVTDLSAAAGVGGIALMWVDRSSKETGYVVERAANGGPWTALASLDANTTVHSDMAALEGTPYSYRVMAVRNNTASAAVSVGPVTMTLPAPANLAANRSGSNNVLSWTDRSSAETGFMIERSLNGLSWLTLATVAVNVTTYTDTAAAPTSAHHYRIRATHAAGNSEACDAAFVAAAQAPQAPTALAATGVADTEVALTWERTGVGETGVTVWRSVAGGPYAALTTLAAGSNIYTDTSCYPSTAYSYRLTAENAVGSSAPSATANATTKASGATRTAATALTATATSAFNVTVSWTDPNGGGSWFVERSTAGGPYTVIAVVPGTGAAMSYSDTLLSPSTTYAYRTRMNSWTGYSNYTAPASVTTQGRPAATPLEPTGFTAVVNGATSVGLSWEDRNGGAAQYVIETAPFSWTDNLNWTQAAVTAPGATTYTLATAAETFYNVRVRARTAAGDSGNVARLTVRTASPGTAGGPKEYHIGPGQTYTSLGALDWSKLGPGDSVYIHPNRDAGGTLIPYHEKPMISVRGTAAAPVRIIGVADPATGAMPVIDGTNAVAHAQWNRAYMPMGDFSLVLVTTRPDQNSGGWAPGHFSLENLEIRDGYSGDPGTSRTYTAWDGTARNYGVAWGVYIEKGDHITIKGCDIHGNNGGVFGAGQGDHRNLESLTLASNRFYGNGTVNSYLEHSTYIEGIDTIYDGNEYGPLRPGAQGGALKDRGAGTVIRYNTLEGGLRLLDFVETQNYYQTVLALPSYHRTYVYGNVFYNTAANGSVAPIHYGGDQGNTLGYRKGVLSFYNNTFINRMDQSQQWRIHLFALEQGSGAVDARNNVIYARPDASQIGPEFNLLPPSGVGYFGRNWVSPGVTVSRPDITFAGHVAGTAHFIGNGQNDPGFADFAGGDYRPTAASQLVDQSWDLHAHGFPVLYQHDAFDGEDRLDSRATHGIATDLGAFEYRP